MATLRQLSPPNYQTVKRKDYSQLVSHVLCIYINVCLEWVVWHFPKMVLENSSVSLPTFYIYKQTSPYYFYTLLL